MKFVFEKIDIKYWSLYLKKLILNIEVCIWKNWYWILKFVFEKIDIIYWILYLKKIDIKYWSLYLKKIDIKYWSLYMRKLILNIEVCIWKNWY